MTREDIKAMAGNNEQVEELLMNIILRNIKPELVKAMVKVEIQKNDAEIKDLEAHGVIITRNGSKTVDAYNNVDEEGDSLPVVYQAENALYWRNALSRVEYNMRNYFRQ